eukprot:SM000253S09043  [mRNA]  locus=s253:162747:164764:- [translate_table: standard]
MEAMDAALMNGAPSPSTEDDRYEDGNRALLILKSAARLAACLVILLVNVVIWTVILVVLLPWPTARIWQANAFGSVTASMMITVLGNPWRLRGLEHSQQKAIFLCNHASPYDILLAMRLVPPGTVSMAKKEIVYWPLFGWLYLLSNFPRVDRQNREKAIQEMARVGMDVIKHDLSVIIWPEGTRSEDGRLLPFKKGFVHMALQTRRPIVPMVLTGTHRAWRKSSFIVRPTSVTVTFLPPISTEDWVVSRVDEYVQIMHDLFSDNLPDSQRPSSTRPSLQAAI